MASRSDPASAVGKAVPSRAVRAFALAVVITVVGTLGFYILANRAGVHTTALDCLYMVIITVTTVGYGEVIDLAHVPGGRVFAMFVLVVGAGNFVYLVSALTAFIVEGDLGEIRRRRRMQSKIDKLSDHFIVCGVGKTGLHVAEELALTGRPYAVIEQNQAALDHFMDVVHASEPPLFVIGDATEEQVLKLAGIERAVGLVTALSTDQANLYCVITAREYSARLRIVSRCIEPGAAAKLLKAGASAVVETNRIGGRRMVSEMVRPHVVEFLDVMLRDRDRNVRVEELQIQPGSPLDGRVIRDADLRRHGGVVVVAVFHRGEGRYEYAPGPEFRMRGGDSLIVLADAATMVKLRAEFS